MGNKFNIDGVIQKAHKALNIGGLAQAIAEQTRQNIESVGRIDSGVMRETIYIVTQEINTYGSVTPSGFYRSSKTGYMSFHRVNGMADLEGNDALVGIAADYTAHNEIADHFLYSALEMGEQFLGKVVEQW